MLKHLETISHLEGVDEKGNSQDFKCRDKGSPGLTGAVAVVSTRFILCVAGQSLKIKGLINQIYHLD